MKAYFATLEASLRMLGRNRVLLATSLGLALISIFVFGWLFGSNNSPKLRLGLVDQDGSTISTQLTQSLKATKSLNLYAGAEDAELQSLRTGKRDAVLVITPDFAADMLQGHGALRVYYDQSNPVTQAIARMAVQSIVQGINANMSGRPESVTLSEQAVSVHALRQIDWLTPGMLGSLLMWANLTVGTILVGWRKEGVLRRLAATPLRPSVLIGAQISARIVLSLAQGALLLIVAKAVFGVQVVGSWLALGAVVALGALALLSIGFVIGAFARSQEVAQTVSMLISFPMMFLAGSYFPTSSAPAFLTPIVQAMPLSYINDALRLIVNNGAGFAAVQTDLLILGAWTVAALLLSVRAFRWS